MDKNLEWLQQNLIVEDEQVKLVINLELYSLSAIKKTAYKFAARCSLLLQNKQAYLLSVLFIFPEHLNSQQRHELIGNFCNELIDQYLRETIACETEGTQNLILAQAFSKTSLIS